MAVGKRPGRERKPGINLRAAPAPKKKARKKDKTIEVPLTEEGINEVEIFFDSEMEFDGGGK